MSFDIGQILKLASKDGFRVWEITSVNIGTQREENTIGLISLDKISKEMFVPECILLSCNFEIKE